MRKLPKMKILIDILHPAHVHIFHYFVKEMEKRGHEIILTARKKDVALQLLDKFGIKYRVISALGKKKIDLARELITRTAKLRKIVKEEKPDLLMGCMGPSISVVGKLTNTPALVFYNNESAKLVNSFVYKLATKYITSSSYEENAGKNHITHKSYHELAYLHPEYFTPDSSILEEVGLVGQKFFIVRFVSFASSHDFGVTGLTDKLRMCKLLEQYGRVVITSEKELPPEFDKYRISISPEKLHDLVGFAEMCVGESATLAAEAAVLGVPAVYIASSFRGYTNELEKDYGLVYNFKNQPEGEAKIKELLNTPNLKEEWRRRCDTMLSDKSPMTSWVVDYVEEYWKNMQNKAPTQDDFVDDLYEEVNETKDENPQQMEPEMQVEQQTQEQTTTTSGTSWGPSPTPSDELSEK